MTVQTATSDVLYNGDGVSVTFPIPFYFQLNSQIHAYVNGAIVAPASISGAGNPDGGSLTFLSAPPVGVGNVYIERQTDFLQESSYLEGGKFPAKSIEDNFDKLTMQDQELQSLADRSVKFPPGESAPDLPSPAERANKIYAFDDDGNPIFLSPNVAGGGIAQFITITDAGGYYASNNVEGALQEVGHDTNLTGNNLTPVPSWDDVPELGSSAINAPAQALLNRFEYLGGASGAGRIGYTQAAAGSQKRTQADINADRYDITDFMTSAQRADFRARTGLVDQSSAFNKWLSSGENIRDIPPGLILLDAPILLNDGTTGFVQRRIVGSAMTLFKGTSNLAADAMFKLVGSASLQQYFNEFGGFRMDLNGALYGLWVEALRNFDVTHFLYLTDSSANANAIGIVAKNSFNVCIKNYQPQTTGLAGIKILGRAADPGFSQITNVAVRDSIMQNATCQILADCDIAPDTILIDNTAFKTTGGAGLELTGTTYNAVALRSVHCDSGSECFIETQAGTAAYITVQDCLISNTNNVYKLNATGELHLLGTTRHVGGAGHKLFPVCNANVTCDGRVLADSSSYDLTMQAGSTGSITNLRRRIVNAAADTVPTNAQDNSVYYSSGGVRNFYLPDITTCGQSGFTLAFQQQGGAVQIRSYAAMTLTGVAGSFAVGETITGSTSAKTAIVRSYVAGVLVFYSASGAFTVTETITGGTSGATATLSSQVGDSIDSGALAGTSIGATLTSSASGSSARVTSKYDGTQRRWFAELSGTWAKSG